MSVLCTHSYWRKQIWLYHYTWVLIRFVLWFNKMDYCDFIIPVIEKQKNYFCFIKRSVDLVSLFSLRSPLCDVNNHPCGNTVSRATLVTLIKQSSGAMLQWFRSIRHFPLLAYFGSFFRKQIWCCVVAVSTIKNWNIDGSIKNCATYTNRFFTHLFRKVHFRIQSWHLCLFTPNVHKMNNLY